MGLSQLENQLDAGNTAKSRTVIVWGRADLLSWAVEFFLSVRKDWDVTSLANERGIDNLIQEIEMTHPDVVILYQPNYASGAYLPAQLLLNYPDLTVVTVNPENNSMEVYNKKQFYIHDVADLISVVEGKSIPGAQEKCEISTQIKM